MKYGSNRGFVKLIIIVVIILIALGYFGFSVRDIVNKPTVQGNLSYVWDFVVNIWNNFLLKPAIFVWDKIIIGIVWNSLVTLIGQAQTGVPQ